MKVSPGRYHAGERAAQRLAGVADEAEAVGRIVGDSMSPAVARFLAGQRLVIAASLDAAGRPWASVLSGPVGFLRATDDTVLRIDARPAVDDPLSANLAARPELGLLVLDPETRRRVRLNGRGRRVDDRLVLRTNEVYGNCPKYIRQRRVAGEAGPRGAAVRTARLGARQMRAVATVDTFFLASFHPDTGADASHRGGDPGFVRVRDERHLEFPDHRGNAMFNTLGNLLEYPRVGLLFLDFATGDTLQLTGTARVRFEPERSVAVEVDEVVATAAGHGLVWEPVEDR